MKNWRLLDNNPLSAADHMALDEVLLASRSAEKCLNTLRFLQFSPRCALLGLHQAVELEIDEDYCRREHIEVNRRITGGGAIFWGPSELGWEIYAGKDWLAGRNIDEVYKLLCDVMVKALKDLGVEAMFRPRNDIQVGHRKICGTGGAELGNAFVFQCSLLVDFDVESMVKVLKIPLEKISDKNISAVEDRVTWLKRELGQVPDMANIKEAICAAFSSVMDMQFMREELNPWEEVLFLERRSYFHSNEWIYKVHLPTEAGEIKEACLKTPGGLIRVVVKTELKARVLKSVLISGDFFTHNPTVIFELEARLKDCPLEGDKIEQIIRSYFKDYPDQIPGVTAQNLESCVRRALR
jgi:lipoate-protein ligase A